MRVTTTRSIVAAAAALSLGAAACDPILAMHGTVRAAPNVCEPTPPNGAIAVPPPIANAKVTLRCRDHVVLEATTDDKGQFANGTAGMGSSACVVRIEKAGYETREVKLLDHCINEDGRPDARESGPCIAQMLVELEPAGAAPAPTPSPAPK